MAPREVPLTARHPLVECSQRMTRACHPFVRFTVTTCVVPDLSATLTPSSVTVLASAKGVGVSVATSNVPTARITSRRRAFIVIRSLLDEGGRREGGADATVRRLAQPAVGRQLEVLHVHDDRGPHPYGAGAVQPRQDLCER